MKTQIQPIGPMIDGLVLNTPADQIADSAMSGCRNVFIEDGMVKKKYGYAQLGLDLPLNGAIIGSDQFSMFDGQSYLIVITTNEIYLWNPSTTTWTRGLPPSLSTGYGVGLYGAGYYSGLAKAAYGGGVYGLGSYGEGSPLDSSLGTSLSVIDSDAASYDTFKQIDEDDVWWLFTNGVDEIKKYSGGSYFEDLGGLPPKAKHLVEFKSHLLLLDTVEGGYRNPQRVRWSDTGNCEEWNDGNSSYVDLTGSDWIQGAVKFRGNYLAVFKERSIWLGYATGDDQIFQFDLKTLGMGCAAANTIDVINDTAIFLGWDDVYLFDGVSTLPISQSIRTELFATLNPAEIGRAFGVTVEEQKEYWLFVPTTGTYPDTAWVYNYEIQRWTKHTYPHNITSFGFYQSDNTLAFDDLIGTFDGLLGRFDNKAYLATASTILLGDENGYIYQYDSLATEEDGTIIDGYFDTKDFNFTNMTQQQRVTGLDVSYVGNNLEIYYSTDKGASWVYVTTLGSSTTFARQQVNIRTSEDWIRFRFRNKSIGGQFSFSRANIYWQVGGRI